MNGERFPVSRLALIGAVIAAVISVLCVLAPVAVLAYEWVVTQGQIANAGHPPLSVYIFTAAMYFVPALSLLGLLMVWIARRGMAWSSPLRLSFWVHATALLVALIAWIWVLAVQG